MRYAKQFLLVAELLRFTNTVGCFVIPIQSNALSVACLEISTEPFWDYLKPELLSRSLTKLVIEFRNRGTKVSK